MSLSCTAGPRKRTAKKASMTCTDQGLRSALAGSRLGGLTGTYSAFGAIKSAAGIYVMTATIDGRGPK
jgi:hypothetical protein